MNKVYTRINWENEPSDNTPLNETNLNKMDFALNEVDNRLIEQDTTKLSKTDASNDIVNWTMNEETGVITVTRRSGEKIIFDLNIEKIPVSFSLSDDGILTMVTDDGTQFKANIGAMIPILTFNNSNEIAVSVSGTGINKTYSFSIKDNSITENKLQPNFLADIKVQSASASLSASNAETSAIQAQSYAVGGTGTRDNEDTDNAMYYYEQAKKTDIGQISLRVDEINSNLNSEISRAKEADEILKSRVDNITSLPEGSTTGDAELQDIRVKADGTTATSAGNAVREQFSELKEDLVNHEKHSNDVYRPINLVDYPYKVYENSVFENQGWEANRGKIISGAGTVIILKVKPSTQYWLNQISNVLYNVVLYDENMEFVALAFPDYATSFNNWFNIPDNVQYVGYMDYASTSNHYFGLYNEKTLWSNGKKNILENSIIIPQITDVENEIENVRADVNSIISKSNKRLKVASDSLSSGNKLELNTSNIKSSNIISFRCDLSTLGTIKFGRGVDASWSGMFVSIDSQYITFYARENNLDVSKYSVEHGLNISTFIDVTLNIYDDQSIKLIVNTISGTFTHDSTWVGRYGNIFVQPMDCTISNVELTYYSNSYDRKLWCFGDSYFDFWNQYVYPYGCEDTMFDSFGGRTSIVAMDSLNECLKYGKPKQILWCMGMNDPDSSSAVNSNWKTIYDRLTEMCETNDIELILCTIPSTNSYNHSFKNEIIKNSGFRYVDISNAMGADISTDWYSGFKSSDDIHPTTLGAKSIASRMMVDIPEMLG